MIISLAQRLTAIAISAAILAATSALARAEVSIGAINIGLPNTVILRIDGAYTGNEVLRVKSAIAALPPTTRVIAALSSPGGLMTQGRDLGQFFFESKIPTIVLAGETCASACTLAFYGGRDPVTGKPQRILVDGALLGFHNFRSSGLVEKDYTAKDLRDISRASQQLTYDLLAFFQSVDAPIEVLLLLANSAVADDMLWLDSGRALKYGISVLNRETGTIVVPDNLDVRMGKP